MVDYRFGEIRRPKDEAGRAGISPVMMDRFCEFVALAEHYRIKLIVALLNGWMSGRLFVPTALQGRPLLSDPDSFRWQVRFVSYFVNVMKTKSAILAWDLGNECNAMERLATAEQAYVGTATLANAIKANDPSRPLLSGMHSLLPKGVWTIQDQSELTDVLTTHPSTPYGRLTPTTTN